MGEPGAACLLRSFSHPSDASREIREGDPICCLTDSISFGRFISESLAWEKWSTFSHNRYLEEVEKFSKPGSVAEKRAFFEAHYKKKAAAKVAASQLTEASAASGVVQESESTCIARDNSSLDSMKTNNHVAASQVTEASAASVVIQESENTHTAWDNSCLDSANTNYQVAASQLTEASAASVVVQESENTCIAQDNSSVDSAKAKYQVAASPVTEVSTASGVVQESEDTCTAQDNSSLDAAKANEERSEAKAEASHSEEVSAGIVHESDNINLAQENSSIDLDPSVSEANKLVQSDEQHEEDMLDVCVKNSIDAGVSVLSNAEDMLETLVKGVEESYKGNSDENLSQCEVISLCHSDNVKNHVERTTSQSNEVSIKEAIEEKISTSADKKKPEASTSKLSIQKRFSKFPFSRTKETTSLPSRNGKYANRSSDKSVVNAADKKVLTTKTLHMSINFASKGGNTNKTVPPVLQLIRKTGEHKLPPKIRKDFSVQHRSSTTTTELDSKQASGTQKAYNKRSEALHSKSISGCLIAEKSSEIRGSNALGSKAQYPIVCSPFRFRSEERAAKRKEKLEEKINAKEQEKLQLHENIKRKEVQNIRKSQRGFGFKTRVSTESSQQVQSSSNLRKPSHTVSQSPISGKKIASRTDQDTRSKPPGQTSVNVNGESFKYIKGKGNCMMAHSVTSLTAGRVHENASPNIQAHNERRKAV